MTTNFQCAECGGKSICIAREVTYFDEVVTDNVGGILYFEKLPHEEKYSCYICGDCGKSIIYNREYICDEETLKKYLEEFGVEDKSANIGLNKIKGIS